MERRMKVPFWSGVATTVAACVIGAVMMMAPSGSAAPGSHATAECTNGQVTASYRGGDAAMSHVYGRIVLRNTSEVSCWIRGYGGLSYVGGGAGRQVGAAADRTPSAEPKVVLAPGDEVRSAVVETSTGPYPARRCRPTPVDGFRVYLPDQTSSQFVEHVTTGCANPAIHLLSHRAYR
jgi:uncharacterized protein DUF4232